MSMRKFACGAVALFAALFGVQLSVGVAETLTINVSTDVWVREKSPTSTYEDDTLLIAAASSRDGLRDGGKERRSAVEFDLSGITQQITGAYLNLYDYVWTGTGSENNSAIVQVASSMSTHGIASLTWNTMGSYTDFESFGAYNLPQGHDMGQYYRSSDASAADVTVLEALRTSTDKKLTVLLRASFGCLNWGDQTSGGNVAQLVVTTVPEPSVVAMFAGGLFGLLAYAWRKHR